jgi:hypothetical protein
LVHSANALFDVYSANTVTGYNGVIEGLLLLAIIFVADVLGQMIAT